MLYFKKAELRINTNTAISEKKKINVNWWTRDIMIEKNS